MSHLADHACAMHALADAFAHESGVTRDKGIGAILAAMSLAFNGAATDLDVQVAATAGGLDYLCSIDHASPAGAEVPGVRGAEGEVTALAEICAVLAKAKPPARDCVRFVLLGCSAEKAVYAEMLILRDAADPKIEDCLVLTDAGGVGAVIDFTGWAIRDRDSLGVWHDVA